MKHNMGQVERLIRMALGVVLFLLGRYLGAFAIFGAAVTSATITGFVIALVGVVLFVTGAFAYCPLDALLHVNSCGACRIGETHKHMPV